MISAITQSADFAMALEHYHISPREAQVFMLLIEGKKLYEIANKLHITSSTTQDHIRNMLLRTESKNRSEMIGKVLGLRYAVKSA